LGISRRPAVLVWGGARRTAANPTPAPTADAPAPAPDRDDDPA
jgi:hypothetical protein